MTPTKAAAATARAKAHPTKAFFVRMLTRDITQEDCILDLIDNSVDAAWSWQKARPTRLTVGKKLSRYTVTVTIDRDRFAISDNCGGISLDDAIDYAFTFGRAQLEGRTSYSVGVYGIGMKRAVFKLGNAITVRSTHENDEPFEVPIDVDAWLSDPSPVWDFEIDQSVALPEPGLQVEVSRLTEESATTFSDPGFVNTLRSAIARDYMLALMQGLTIVLNGKPIDGWPIGFREGGEFAPMRVAYDEGEVAVEIIAGMISPPPPTNEPSSRPRHDPSGWYVLCNGRVVLAADRSELTGWGRGIPNWHGQYDGFLGVVLFSSPRPELLPMTTTKNGVDASSALYRRALTRMQEPTRSWIDYTNSRKVGMEEARRRESEAKPVPITKVKERPTISLPTGINEKKEANVLYSVPLSEMRALGKAFGRSTMAYREVGMRSFRYAYERLVSEAQARG